MPQAAFPVVDDGSDPVGGTPESVTSSPDSSDLVVARESTVAAELASPAALHREFLAQTALTNWSMHRLTVLIRRMEACEGHVEYGCPTLAHYLELVCGVSRIAARQRIRVARALGELPLIDREFAAGRLSYAKVRSLVRIATPRRNGSGWRRPRSSPRRIWSGSSHGPGPAMHPAGASSWRP
jgi:hypothetical protein